jgi:predicted transposase YbfD/YdcC
VNGSASHPDCRAAHDAGMVTGQRCVDGKSNEITAILLLLETLALEGTIVTIDTMGTRKIIAQATLGKKADYFLLRKETKAPSMMM